MKNNIYTAIISHARPQNVPGMKKLCEGLPRRPVWYVGKREMRTYYEQGVSAVASGELCASRNKAIDDARASGAEYCLQLSDDLRRIKFCTAPGVARVVDLPFVVDMMSRRLGASLYSLAGVAPTANAYFYTGKPINNAAFIVGDMILISTRSDVRFDEKLKLKEDYDFTAAHMLRFGGVVRCNDILAEFLHGSNPGGAVDVRSDALEKKSITYLRQKWGNERFPDNKKRENEVLFRWPVTRAQL